MWGASYLFIKVALEDIPPAAMTELRVLLAGVLLFGYLAVRVGATRAVAELRAAWVPCAILGVINAAVPMGLVAWGETHIDSSVAGIAQSTVPLFTFILAAQFLPHEHVGLTRVAGVAIGFLGVALLAGFPSEGGWWALAGTLAVVLSSLSYASGGVYGQLQVRDIAGPVLATGNMLAAAIVLLPLAIVDPPTEAPGPGALAGLAGLILIPTFAGQLAPLPRAAAPREPQALDRHVPHPRVRRRIRRAPARRARDCRDARRVLTDRRGRRPRVRPALLRLSGAADDRMNVSIRRARSDDVDFLVHLLAHEQVEPFLAASRAKERSDLLADIVRSEDEPEAFGLFVVEADGQRAGTMRFERTNTRSRIADLGGLAVHPDFRGAKVSDTAARLFQRHLFDELGFHRVQMEIYGFNERAMRHAERAGFVREGVRRKAYWRNDEWVDGVLYGLVVEDLDEDC